MTLYSYVKAPPGYTLKKPSSLRQRFRTSLSLFLLVGGIAAITTVAYPLISYQLFVAPGFQKTANLSPLSAPTEPTVAGQSDTRDPQFVPELINNSLDYTQAGSWFPQAKNVISSTNTYYTFSVPKLGIKDALVKLGAEDLKESLIHYGDTALPGTLGNPVIFGHSVLPQFFSPTNYTSIFSTLHTLSKGDEFIINYDGVEYRYVIDNMYEVLPTNLSPLLQTYNDYHLTVITCTPPGTYLRRLIIEATLT